MKTRKHKKGRKGENRATVQGKQYRLTEEGRVEWERGEWRREVESVGMNEGVERIYWG